MWPLLPRCHFESIPKVRRSQVLASLAGWLLTQTRTTINVDNVFGGGDDDDDDVVNSGTGSGAATGPPSSLIVEVFLSKSLLSINAGDCGQLKLVGGQLHQDDDGLSNEHSETTNHKNFTPRFCGR